jgi:hypothetical protein
VSQEVLDDMALFGLADEVAHAPTFEDVQPAAYEIWPESLKALNVFLALENQWDIVISPDGELIRTGIRFPSIEVILKRTNGIPKREWNQLFDHVRMMERVALKEMTEARIARQERRQAEEENRSR